MIGQYPGVFSAAALRNPVVSVGEIVSVSDIGDWTYTPGAHITPELCAELYTASPIAHADKVRTPVLLLIGGEGAHSHGDVGISKGVVSARRSGSFTRFGRCDDGLVRKVCSMRLGGRAIR